ncbi:PACE efflux transporter [Pseudaeromonas sharmana]|uniref:PACE efflux transporter n=1 Tax=Pseudaeromonas sharmana TaxID=328412 RepID=A0ABV8CJL5_9GAMM
MKMKMRTGADRLRHTVGFELCGMLLSVPLLSLVTGQGATHLGALAIGFALLAAGWNYLYNLGVDHLMLRVLGRLEKRLAERVLHALLFEVGFLLIALPLTAWWLGISLWQALLLDIGMALFYVVYAFVYNLAYDRLFPLMPAGRPTRC